MVIPYLCKKIFQIYFIGKWLFLILGTQRRSFTSERFLQIVGLVTHESAYSILFPSQNLQRCYKISISKFKLLFRFGQREGNNGPVFWWLIDTLLKLREKAVMELTKNPSLSKHDRKYGLIGADWRLLRPQSTICYLSQLPSRYEISGKWWQFEIHATVYVLIMSHN